MDCECSEQPSESKENKDCYNVEHCQHDALSLGVFLRVLVAPRGVTNHNADNNQEDEEIEDEDGSNRSKEGGVEYNTMAYETAAGERETANDKTKHMKRKSLVTGLTIHRE